MNLARSITKDGSAFSISIDATEIVSKMKDIHKTCAATSIALGRLTVAGAMMGSLLKGDSDSLTVSVNGGGPAGTLMVVANGTGCVKSCIDNSAAGVVLDGSSKVDVQKVVGKDGVISVAKKIGLAAPYVSQVPLVSGEIGDDVAGYYANSEQIPTVCAVGVLLRQDLTVKCAGGFLIQALPYADENTISVIENNVAKIRSVSKFLEQGMTPKEISLKVLEKTEPNLLCEQSVKYHCGCGKNRVEKMLIGLGERELERMVFEGKSVEVECHFCDKVYVFNVDDLKRLLNFCRLGGENC